MSVPEAVLWGPKDEPWDVELLEYSIKRDVSPLYCLGYHTAQMIVTGKTFASGSFKALSNIDLRSSYTEIGWSPTCSLVILHEGSRVQFDHVMITRPDYWFCPTEWLFFKGQTIHFNYADLARE